MPSLVARGLAVLACAGALAAQSPAPAAPAPTDGFETPWEIAPVFTEVSAYAGRLLGALDRIDARAWVQKGASETYERQLESSKQQARALQAEAKALAANPDRLSDTLVALFRIQGLDRMLVSIQEVMRRYQSPAAAQALASLVAENGISRDRVQHYIVNLAIEREHDLKVMDEEAQRCRATFVATPAAQTKKK